MQQEDDESSDSYHCRLRTSAKYCEFGTTGDAEIEQQILTGFKSSSIRKKRYVIRNIS